MAVMMTWADPSMADATGLAAAADVPLSTATDLKVTDTSPLPNATVGGSYNHQLTASGGVPPYTWSSVPAFPFNGLALAAGGVISGTATATFTQAFAFTVSDSIPVFPNQASATLSLSAQASGLVITTAGPLPVPSGRSYSSAPDLQASGSPNLPYTWSIDPSSAQSTLPSGLTLNPNTGVISGLSTVTGFDKFITFRVTDSIGAYAIRAIEVKVLAQLALQSGIDFADSLSTGSIGYVSAGAADSINPRPNRAFYVVASGVVSTSPDQIQVAISNTGITATVDSLDTVNRIAYIKLSGVGLDTAVPLSANSAAAPSTLTISVTDSGVTATANFTWTVFNDGVLRVASGPSNTNPGPGQLPLRLTTPQ